MRASVLGAALGLGLVVSLVPAVTASAAPPLPARPRPATSSGTATHVAPRAVHVGSVDLTPCDVTEGALCGSITRPWDPTGAVPGTLSVGFAFVPAATSPAIGTVVPHEGGPGYSTTGSADSYAAMYGPLLERRNLLLVDQRGTGLTEPIDCPELQELTTAYATAAARCARRLGDHAHLYGTALSADDLAAVVTALGLGKVDVYGDSYGTFFTQVYASRHPQQVRSLVLDSAYPTYGETAWYPTMTPAMRGSFDRVCAQTPTCAALGTRTSSRLATLAASVRRNPLVGNVFGGDGALHRIRLDAPKLLTLAFNATYGPVTYRELDAAIRAWSTRRDVAPLLRLVAEMDFPGGGTSDPVDYSEGADAAVACQDYPQLYDMTQAPAVRRAQLTAAVARQSARNPRVYAPFTISEFLHSDWQTLTWCTGWPSAPAPYKQGPITPPGGRYPASVPVLVLSGALDSITTPAEGAMVAKQWPNARQVVVASSFHVTAVADVDRCAESIFRAFVTTPTMSTIRTRSGCARRVPPIRATTAFLARSAEAAPARPLAGSTTSRVRLSAARATADTVADLIDRWYQTYEVGGRGLRGGSWTSDGYDEVTFTLSRYRFTRDLAVSGTVVWNRYTHAVTVALTTYGTTTSGATVRGSALTGRISGRWDSRAAGARAVLTGVLGGQRVRALITAP
ncbi:MAG: alpha/beta hydrolase [Candidatus Nanopelagicales bacterium]